MTPEVSVVIICFNDAANLPRAVDSVLRQSLRRIEVIIADDCSTDDTAAVAQALAAADPRVAYVRLPENSGGCGGPRNAGIEASSAPYLMFLDSDDELEQHACYNLWLAARDNDCDVVSGKCRRHHLRSNTWTTWYADLYAERRVLTDLDELPRIVYDSISTNMLYRRSFLDQHGLRFPMGVKYEDLQFTARVYSTVRRFGIIPETVYHWRIYPTEERRTITHSRSDPPNLRDRLAAIEFSRQVFSEHGKPGLHDAITDKFLHHDARITIDDVVDAEDADLRAEILDILDPHLRSVPRENYRALAPMDRAAYAMALLRDYEGLFEARLFALNRGAQAGRIRRVGDRLLWTPLAQTVEPAPGSLEEYLCDVTDDHLLDTPVPSLRMAHVITGGRPAHPGVELEGTTHDTLNKFTDGPHPPRMTLRVRARKHAGVQSIPVEVTGSSRGVITWRVRIPSFEERDNTVQTRWWLALRTEAAGRVNDSELCLAPHVQVAFREPNGATQALGATIELYRTRLRDAALRRVRLAGAAARPALALHRVDRAKEIAERVTRRRRSQLRERYYHAARRLPLRADTVLFDSHMGKQFSDNPKAVYDELVRRDTGLTIVWDFLDPTAHPQVPGPTIQRHTLAYSDLVARAAAIVDNQGLPAWVTKRPDQFHLQTWHGTPLKRMALHKLENLHALPSVRDRIVGEAAWDALVSPSEYFEQTFVDAYRYTGELIRGGSPRNDVLINHPEPDPELWARLDLPRDRKIALYAPTFREELRHARTAATVLLDLDRWVEEFGSTHFLLIRSHYLNRFAIGRRHLPYVMNVSHVEEISDLYRVADFLITDYSSVMFDYAWLDRPILIYAPDYDRYVHDTRGTYFELRDDNPGRFCESQDDLHHMITDLDDSDDWRGRLREFRERYCGVEDGKASVRAVDRLLAALGREGAGPREARQS